MKMIASRELSARPAAVWGGLAREGAVVITRDGLPLGIITPTSPETLLEDMQEIVFAKARRSVRALRESAVKSGTDRLSMDEIDAEIKQLRREKKRPA
jgi:hypothetical protein